MAARVVDVHQTPVRPAGCSGATPTGTRTSTGRTRSLGGAFVARGRAMPGLHAPVGRLTDDRAADDLPIEPPVVRILREPFTLAALRAAVRRWPGAW